MVVADAVAMLVPSTYLRNRGLRDRLAEI